MTLFDENGKYLPTTLGDLDRFNAAKIISGEIIREGTPKAEIPKTEIPKVNDGFVQKIASNVKGHWNNPESKIFGKARIGLGAIVIPAVLLVSATKDVVGEKKKDKTGQEIDRSVIKPLLKTAAALGVAALALRGGANKLSR